MLNPSVVDLLRGVANSLAVTVAERLPIGPERDQVKAAVAILRRIAGALPGLTAALQADIRALADAVTILDAATGPAARTPDVADALTLADRMPPAPPSLDELLAADLALRTALAAFAERTDLAPDVDAALRAELAALAARDVALGLSPWEP